MQIFFEIFFEKNMPKNMKLTIIHKLTNYHTLDY